MAVGTCLLAIFAFRQLRIASNTARQQLRAYMCLKSAGCGKIEVGAPVVVHIVFTNAGQTPAYDFDCKVFDCRSFGREVKDFLQNTKSHTEPVQMLCGPGGEVDTSFSVNSFGKIELDWLNDGILKLWIYGRATYRDCFNEWHEFKFRLYARSYEHQNGTRWFSNADKGNEEISLPGTPAG